MKKTAALAIAPLFLAACGGGGGGTDGGTTPPPAANAPPSFTSAQTASVVENGVAAYQATATDPDGNALTFTIDGGADAALLSITAAGALSFKAAPDYDLPGDADGDNVYAVQLRVSDGRASATQLVNVTVTNSREGISLVRVATGFDKFTTITPIAGDSRFYATMPGGRIYLVDPADGSRTLALQAADVTRFRSIAAYPDHTASRRILAYVISLSAAMEVRSYRLGQPDSATNYQTVFSIPSPSVGDYNSFGHVAFGPDGYGYATTGDGGIAGDTPRHAQNKNGQLGKVLRFAITGNGSTFAPAPGNPYIAGGGDPYVFALGLRTPSHPAFYQSTLLVADVGPRRIHEVNMLPIATPGLNFGWSFREGTEHYSGTAPADLTSPVIEVQDLESDGDWPYIDAGYVYRGPIASLQGQYLFKFDSRTTSGAPMNIYSVPFASLKQGETLGPSRFALRNEDFILPDGSPLFGEFAGQDNDGNIFFATPNGDLYRLQPG